jgi:hypothetical protein
LDKLTRRGENPRTENPIVPAKFTEEIKRVLARRPILHMSFTTSLACYKVFEDKEGGTLSDFREASTSAEGGQAPVYFPGTEGDYANGILDLREL